MKIIITSTVLMLGVLFTNAQHVMKVSAGASVKTSGGVNIVLSNMDLENDGTISQSSGEGGFRFSGNQSSAIKGASLPTIGILEVNKTNGAKLFLNRNISVSSLINFISGQLDLNGSNIVMVTDANIAGESETNRIVGAGGGFVEIRQTMNAPAAVNAGNLGATISSSATLGQVTIRRGHVPQSGTGLSTGINRYYSIVPDNNSNLNATLRLKYFDAELNGQDEPLLVIYKSDDNGANWANMSQTTLNNNANYVEKTGMSDFSLQTIANNNVVASDGVTGVELTGQRRKATEVTLKWNSLTETNMSGYQIQRKLDNEADFSDRAFVNTLAPGGNSNSQLSYQNVDANSYTGLSHYRLKIMTARNTFTYSNVIAVPGKTKGGGGGNGNPNNTMLSDEASTSSSRSAMPNNIAGKITVGPNPNNGNFWFSVNGIGKETIATLFTIDGKQIQQFRVVNLQQQRVNNIRTGIYLLKVPGFETQKIIVNSGSSSTPAQGQTIPDKSKL
ncbi:MAG TPA: T9SS type A sorting domain-containing protein [Chitinophagaceae bacterium]